jgi:Fe-S cluster assembly protein SufB
LLETYAKLGIPLRERKCSRASPLMSCSTPFPSRQPSRQAKRVGVIFCSISEAVKEHPELVKKYMGSVVPFADNKHACLNSAVFTDGSFVYIPPGVRCPMELSTYFRINELNTGQFERTLIIADKGSYVSRILRAAPHRCAMCASFTPPWSN